MKGLLVALVIASLLLLVACGADPSATPTVSQSPDALPNVATEHCLGEGYQLLIQTEADGTTGHCLFPDGSRCELWAFYHGECPGPETLPRDHGEQETKQK